jgi:hypothetical protein
MSAYFGHCYILLCDVACIVIWQHRAINVPTLKQLEFRSVKDFLCLHTLVAFVSPSCKLFVGQFDVLFDVHCGT